MMSFLAAIFAALAAVGVGQTLRYSRRPERNAFGATAAKLELERRIDLCLILTLTAVGASITLETVATDGPVWSSVIGIVAVAITMVLLRRQRLKSTTRPTARGRGVASPGQARR